MQVQFLANPIEGNAQLQDWGVDRDRLKEAVFFAESFYNECTLNDPRGFDRLIAYARCGRRLRDLYAGKGGWSKDDTNNQTAIRNHDLRLRIYPCNFCSHTADPSRDPVNLTDKGSAARGDARRNEQLSFPFAQILPGAQMEADEKFTTLLLGMNFEGVKAKAELSLPVKFMNGKFTGLLIRVPILDGTEDGPTPAGETGPDDLFGEVDIPIGRKL